MASVLVAWINDRDLEAAGPGGMVESRIRRVVAEEFYARVYLFSASKKTGRTFKKWLSSMVATPLEFERVKVDNLFDYQEVWESTLQALTDCQKHMDEDEIEWSFLLGGDSAVMDAVMIHLAHTEIPAELLQWSRSSGLQVIDVSQDHFPGSNQTPAMAKGFEPATVFNAAANLKIIEHCSPEMTRVHEQARRLAALDVPVLVTGETGTGRELLARAIHKASSRKGAFVAMDCEALEPDEQADALFGTTGLLRQASGGTLLLDSVDHLATSVQASLHRAVRDGQTTSIRGPVDVRLMATATCTPSQLLDSGKMREDFFHCIAIGLIHVPPLRKRPADLEPFVARVLVRITHEMKGERRLSEEARVMIGQKIWPGNHPELEATLRRAAVLTDHVIEVEHIEASIFEAGKIGLDLPDEFDIQKKLDDVARHYVTEALTLNDGNKTKASKMLGLNNYQTLTNWMRRLDVGESI
jgi:transcriptional regulator with PAS, ATPase and Fis domain